MTPSFVSHFDACLGCMACVTSCPSGVQYAPLIEATRAQIERRYPRSFADRLFRGAIFALFPYPGRLRIALTPLAIWQRRSEETAETAKSAEQRTMSLASQRAPRFLPSVAARRSRRAMLSLAPTVTWASLFASIPARTPAVGARAADRRPADRLRAAPRLPARERGDRQRAVGRRLRRARAARPGLLRRAGAARRTASTRRARSRAAPSRSSSAPASSGSPSTPPAADRR